MTLHGQRSRDRVHVVYSRSGERATAFASEHGIPVSTTDLEEAIAHPETDAVLVGLPNHLHEEAIALCARHGKTVLCTKPLARNGEEAKRILDTVEQAGIFAGYLEDLVYTPKTLKAVAAVRAGQIGQVTWARSRETHPGPAQRLVLGRGAGGRRRHRRPRLPLRRDHPLLRRQGKPAGRCLLLGGHARSPDRGGGQRDRADPFRERRDRTVRGQLDVPRRHGPPRRGRRHGGDDLDEPLPPHRVRGVLDRRGRRLRGREGRDRVRVALPGRRRARRARVRRHVRGHARRARRGQAARRDLLRRLRRQRGDGRLLRVGAQRRVGVRASWPSGAVGRPRGSRASDVSSTGKR